MSSLNVNDLSILLVEPSSTQRKIILACLEDASVGNVQEANSGKEAIQLMHGFAPDLVISAMYFEDMTSTDLAKLMRDNEKLDSVPFMLISSEEKDDTLDPLKQLGVIAILPKPFDILDLKTALNATVAYLEPEELDFTQFNIEDLEVLLVDDSRSARRYIKKILSDMGLCKITEAEDGTEAIPLIQSKTFDLIVTDYNMPKMDGGKLLKYIREESAQPYVPVLMVTSESNTARLNAIKQAGVSALCDKPFDVNNVKVLLHNILMEH